MITAARTTSCLAALLLAIAAGVAGCTLPRMTGDQMRVADEQTLWKHLHEQMFSAMLYGQADALYTAGLRRELMERYYPGTPPEHRQLVMMGEVENGMDQVSVSLAWGRPWGIGTDVTAWGQIDRWWWGPQDRPYREATFRDAELVWWIIHDHQWRHRRYR